MSHIVDMNLEIKDLSCLKKACRILNYEFIENKDTFKYWGHKDDICNHTIKIPNDYLEIGLIKNNNKYTVRCDSMLKYDVGILKKEYTKQVILKDCMQKKLRVSEKQEENGIRLTISIK